MLLREEAASSGFVTRAPETIRTSDTFFRREVLYPLSYGGNVLYYSGNITAVFHPGLGASRSLQ